MTDADRERRLEELIAQFLVNQDAGMAPNREAMRAGHPERRGVVAWVGRRPPGVFAPRVLRDLALAHGFDESLAAVVPMLSP